MENGKRERETKRDRFVRLAEQRVNNILEQFRKLGNLSNTRNYDYNEEDIKKMFSEITKAMRKTKALFDENGVENEERFKL